MAKATPLGKIEISPHVIGTLVSHIALQTYGIVDMAVANRTEHIAAALTRDPNRGVGVEFHEDDSLTITVYVVVNYGTNIASTANNLINAIRYHVENRTGLTVKQVNVHIQGLRITSSEKKK